MNPVTEAIQTISNVLRDPDISVSEEDQAHLFETIGLLVEYEPQGE